MTDLKKKIAIASASYGIGRGIANRQSKLGIKNHATNSD